MRSRHASCVMPPILSMPVPVDTLVSYLPMALLRTHAWSTNATSLLMEKMAALLVIVIVAPQKTNALPELATMLDVPPELATHPPTNAITAQPLEQPAMPTMKHATILNMRALPLHANPKLLMTPQMLALPHKQFAS
jgi:hypothetical protein